MITLGYLQKSELKDCDTSTNQQKERKEEREKERYGTFMILLQNFVANGTKRFKNIIEFYDSKI